MHICPVEIGLQNILSVALRHRFSPNWFKLQTSHRESEGKEKRNESMRRVALERKKGVR